MIMPLLRRVSFFACFAALTCLTGFSQSVTVSPTSISFGNQAYGTTSAVHKVTLKNGQTSAITISSISTSTPVFAQTNNCPVGPATLQAGGTCTISATFAPNSQSTFSGTLSVVDTGLSSPQTVNLTGTGTAAILESIAITPNPPSVTVGSTLQLTATGTYSDGSTQNLTTTASWVSSPTSIATIGLHTGLAKGVAAGSATITASLSTVKTTATLTVSSATLVSIAVTPSTASVAAGNTKQFTATGTYSNGTTQNLTDTATWSSSATSVATVSSTGLATTIKMGTATITAASGTISGSATLNVTAAVLTSVAVTPSTASIGVGSTEQFTATGNYSDGSTKNLTTSASWTSSSTSVATVGLHTGLATGVVAGMVTITATAGKVTGTATLTVTSTTLVSIAVTPANPSISLGATQQFTATGTYSGGSTQNITDSVTWSSSATSVATISDTAGSQGLATGVSEGTSTISASLSVTGSTALTVTASPGAWTLYGPQGRNSHSTVWDPNSKQMIIFGGIAAVTNANLNDVWLGTTSTSQSESFAQELPTGTAPQGRYGHIATYDAINNRMMVFGGSEGTSSTCGNDVWLLSGANGQSGTPAWISESPTGTAPAPRFYAAGVYDSNSNSMIVFGGNNCAGGYLNDVWVLSNANGLTGTPAWTQLNPSGTAPRPRESGTAVYDPVNNILILYAGDAGVPPLSDIWVLSNANGTGGTPAWTELMATGKAPLARTGHTATFDSANNRMTIFGGTNGQGFTFSDSWVLTGANGLSGLPGWSPITAQGTAPSLAYHTAVFDSVQDNLYVFGGFSSEGKLQANNHAFTLNGANGISSSGEKWYLGGPAVRYGHSSFYDPVTNSFFVFAGQHSATATNFNDYWQETPVIGSTNLSWVLAGGVGSKPTPRFGHTGIYDGSSNRMMVFGGATGFPAPCMNDYYVMKQANAQGGAPTWLSVTPTGTAPGVRTLQVSAYDGNTNTLMIFGGYNCNSTYYGDVWILQNANDVSTTPNWIQLQPTGTAPSARESASAIYDPNTNSLIVYGGDAGGEPLGDIWLLSNANGTGGTPAWTQLNSSNSGPTPRSGHTATYDSVNNVMTIFGGYDGTNVLGETWVLTDANGQGGPATWTQLTTGQLRRFHTSNYDPISNTMITFGGTTGVEVQAPSADLYTLGDANNVQ